MLLVGSYPATWVAWTGWPWSPLRLAVVLSAIWALATIRSRAVGAALVAAVLVLCPLVAIQVADGYDFDREPAGALVGPAIGAHALVRWHGAPAGWVFLSSADRSYVNGEGDYADADLVATSVTLLPWPSLRRESIIGVGGNTIDYWRDDPQLRRDDSGPLVASTRYHNGANLWEWRRIRVGGAGDLVAVVAWPLVALVLLWRGRRLVAAPRAQMT